MLKNLIITLAAALTAATAAAQAPADWANFGRFEKENAALAEHPKVVLMGNSITEGWIAKRPDFFAENGYASRADRPLRRCSCASAPTSWNCIRRSR